MAKFLDPSFLHRRGISGTTSALVAYVRGTPVPTSLGGITVGDTFSGSVQDALDALLYPYQAPTFSSFSFGQSSPLEVGATIAAGNKTFTWITTNSGNINASTIKIDDITGATNLLTGSSNDGTEVISIGAVTKTSSTGHTWRITGTNTHSANFTRDVTISWLWRMYYGESTNTSLTEVQTEALRVNFLTSTSAGSLNFLGGGYKYIVYSTTLGLKTSFKDPSTNLDVAMEAATTIALTNSNGITQNYYSHRTTNILGGAITIVVS